MSIKVTNWVWQHGPKAPTDRLVLLALADFCNDAGVCWPSMKLIGAKASLSERGARKVVRRLEKEGWLKAKVGGGRGGASRYRVEMQKPEAEASNSAANSERQTGNPDVETRNTVTETRNVGTETRNCGSAEPSVIIKDPSGEDIPLRSPADEFDRIWPLYPKRVAKAAAKKAWVSARRKHSLEEICRGLLAYIRNREGQDQQYTKALHLWLKDERWNDEPDHAANRPRSSVADLRHLATVTASDDLARLMSPPAPEYLA